MARVLVVSHLYPNPVRPHAGIFVHQQVRALKRLGHHVTVVSPVPAMPRALAAVSRRRWYTVPTACELDEVEVHYCRSLMLPRAVGFAWYDRTFRLGLRAILAQTTATSSFDLIHAHVAFPDGAAMLPLAKCMGLPLVVTIHGQDLQETVYRSSHLRAAVRSVIDASDAVVFVSERLKGRAMDLFGTGPHPKWHVIANGTKLPPDSVLPEPGLRTNRVISVGHLNPGKGQDLVIWAVAQLRVKFPNLSYTIVGDGPNRLVLQHLAQELKVDDIVHFVGAVEHDRVWSYLWQASVFALPSSPEAFGIAYLEALACGLPIIGCEGEGVEEIVAHTGGGLLIPPRDRLAVVAALDRLLSDPEGAARMGRGARSIVESDYSWEANARSLAAIYNELTAAVHEGG